MKRRLLILLCILFTGGFTFAQVSGTYTIPGAPYLTIAMAISTINAQGIGAGGVTFNITAGYTETFTSPTAGYITTNTATVANQIIFQKSGSGANPKITAGTGTGTMDAIIAFAGVKYVTFNGIDVYENAANTTTTTQMEWGYAVLKASATQGSQYITIKNCTISLNATNTVTYGIYANNHTTAAIAQLTVTAATGQNSNNKFFSNTITNSYNGIYVNGYADALTPFLYYDQNNEIGKDGANTFTNIGGGASVLYGIYAAYQNNVKIANNSFTGTVTCSTTTYLIYTGSGNNTNVDIYSNSLTITFNSATATIYGIYSAMGNIGATNTVNVYNNTVTINYATATTGSLYCIYHGATAFLFNAYGNNIVNNIIGSASTVGTGTWAGLYTFGNNTFTGSSWNIYNNTVSGNSRVQSTFSTGSCYGIYNSSSGLSLLVYNNTVMNNSWPSSSACYCIYISNSYPNTMIVRKNNIHDNSKPNAVTNVLPRSSSLYGIYASNAQAYSVTTIDSNTVYNLTNTWGGQILPIRCEFGASGTGYVYSNTLYNVTSNDQAVFGIYNSTGLNVNIYKNNLYNMGPAIGDSGSFYGICTGSSTPSSVTTVYNNFISDLHALQAVNYLCSGLYLFGATAGTNFRYYYNTVYLNQTPTGGSPATAAVYAGTVPNLDMRNNILYDNSVVAAGGLTIGIWKSSVTTTTYSANSGFNCIYAGTPGASNLIFFDFTNSDQTIAAYKTRFPQEAQSFTEIPPFVNVATTPYNLHLQTTIATQCESGGQTITSPAITNDYDLQARYPNPGYPGVATAPDVGADEFGGIPSDQVAPFIGYSLLTNGPVAPTRAFGNVAITDASGVNITSGTKPRCYYKKGVNANTYNGNTSATDGWKYVEANGTTTPFDFTLNYSLLSGGTGVALGDVIQYFVVAQDLAGTVHVGINSGTFTTAPTSVNLTAANFPLLGTINNYTIMATISGIITVGTSGTYPNLTGATGLFQAINNSVITGNITANIVSDLTEDGTNALNQWIEDTPSPTRTLTIQPDATTLRTISGIYAGGLIRFNGADRVTVNGSGSGSGNKLTFINTSTSGTVATFQFISLGTNLGATNNKINNCNISTGFNASAAYGIGIGGATVGSTGDDNDNITIQNNVITKAYYGIYAYASPSGMLDNLVISGNTMGTAVATDYISYYGIYLYGVNAPLIAGNEIFNIITATNTTNIGIELSSYVNNAVIVQNKIHDLQNNNTGGWGAYGIDISSTTGTNYTQIINNVIYNITTINYAGGTSYSPFGIRLVGGFGHKIWFNTVHLTGTQFASGSSGTLSASLVLTSTSVGAPDVRDNIFTNNLVGMAGSKSYAVYAPASTFFGTINYNDYYGYGTYGVLGFIGADILTLPAWQVATVQDLNSVSLDPQYVSATDLHPTNATLNNTGFYMSLVPIDYTGALRTSPPDVGAYNFGNDPIVNTTAATAIANTTATLNGTINAASATVSSFFDYGLTTAYGTSTAGVPASVTGTTTTGISLNITGLTASTTYHFRARGVTGGGLTIFGPDLTFTTTNVVAPIVVTNPASNIGVSTAQLNGTVTANNSNTTVSFDWGLTIVYGNNIAATPSPVTGNTPTAVLATIGGLTSGLTYHFRCVGTNIGGTTYGLDQSFVAGCQMPAAAGVITGPTSVCANSTGKVYTVGAIANATTYTWTVPAGASITAGAGTTSITVTFGTTSGNVTVMGTNGCGNGTSSSLAVTVNPLPTPTITGSASGCQGTSAVYTTQAGMTGYTWTVSAGGTITAGAGTSSITVTWNAAGAQTVCVNYTNANGCSAVVPVCYAVTVTAGPTITITGTSSLCVNSGYYNYTTQTGFNNYVWTISAGGTITFGQGTYQIQVTWNQPGAQWVAVNYNNVAGCSAPAPVQFPVTVNPIPGTAGNITGTAAVCGGTNGVAYSVGPVQNATTYVWTLPAGAIIATGGGTNSITVNFNANASSGNITVYGNNLCGNGSASPPFAVAVTPLVAAAGVITGQAAVCPGTSGVVYTVTPITNATAYIWTVPPGATTVSGSSTNSITVDYGTNAQSGNITVAGSNSCGTGTVSPNFPVTVNPIPATPVISLTGDTLLTSNAPAGNQWYRNGTMIPGATGQTYIATQSGTYWVIVTLNGCSSAQSNHIEVTITGIDPLRVTRYALYPVPNDGRFTVTINSQIAETINICVYNNLGSKIFEMKNIEVNGTMEQVIDLRPIATGVYTVVFQNQNGKIVKKILVNK